MKTDNKKEMPFPETEQYVSDLIAKKTELAIMESKHLDHNHGEADWKTRKEKDQ